MDNHTKLYELLAVSAKKHPDLIALVHMNQQRTYSELDNESDLISSILISNNIGRGQRVAIYAHKSIGLVEAIFGILKSGAAYIPVDPNAPPERNIFIINDCETKAIIVHASFCENFKHDHTLIGTLQSGLLLMKNNKKGLKLSPPDLAYILYTSGSTGLPKGVMYTNMAALEFVSWSSGIFKPEKNDTFSSHAPFHFDLSVFDLFVSIKHTSRLILIPEDISRQPMLLAKLISDQKISIWYSTPTILNMLAAYGKMENYNFYALRLVLFAGEVFPIEQFRKLKTIWTSCTYYNLYGPTETNVCTYYKIPSEIRPEEKNSFPIGKCCEHYHFKIINEGELCISGKGIMSGYWASDNNGTESFIYDDKGIPWYKTGDIVGEDPQENLIFKGRIDRMVKRNGYRIELAEIELSLSRNQAISECAVVADTDDETGTTITAFVCCLLEKDESIIKMKEYCIKHLPVYMIPNTFIFLKSLPQTSSNKIDLQQLKQLLQ